MKRIKKLKFILLAAVIAMIPIHKRTILTSVGCAAVYYIEEIANGTLLYVFGTTEEAADKYFSKIPKEDVALFYEDGGTVFILSKEQASLYTSNNVDGFYRDSDHVLFLVDRTSTKVNASVIHEFGHYLDHAKTYGSESEEFITVASEEIERYVATELFTKTSTYTWDSYNQSGTYQEYFAETYADYIMYPSYLKAAAPKTYAFFENYYEK